MALSPEEQRYLNMRPDVAADPYYATNPYEHYTRHGINEGMSWTLADSPSSQQNLPSGWSDSGYLSNNPDVASDPYYGSNAYQHWLDFGQKEGRSWQQQAVQQQQASTQTQSPASYLAAYPDVAADPYYSQNPYAHYQEHGRNEGRTWYGDIPQQTAPAPAPAPTQLPAPTVIAQPRQHYDPDSGEPFTPPAQASAPVGSSTVTPVHPEPTPYTAMSREEWQTLFGDTSYPTSDFDKSKYLIGGTEPGTEMDMRVNPAIIEDVWNTLRPVGGGVGVFAEGNPTTPDRDPTLGELMAYEQIKQGKTYMGNEVDQYGWTPYEEAWFSDKPGVQNIWTKYAAPGVSEGTADLQGVDVGPRPKDSLLGTGDNWFDIPFVAAGAALASYVTGGAASALLGEVAAAGAGGAAGGAAGTSAGATGAAAGATTGAATSSGLTLAQQAALNAALSGGANYAQTGDFGEALKAGAIGGVSSYAGGALSPILSKYTGMTPALASGVTSGALSAGGAKLSGADWDQALLSGVISGTVAYANGKYIDTKTGQELPGLTDPNAAYDPSLYSPDAINAGLEGLQASTGDLSYGDWITQQGYNAGLDYAPTVDLSRIDPSIYDDVNASIGFEQYPGGFYDYPQEFPLQELDPYGYDPKHYSDWAIWEQNHALQDSSILTEAEWDAIYGGDGKYGYEIPPVDLTYPNSRQEAIASFYDNDMSKYGGAGYHAYDEDYEIPGPYDSDERMKAIADSYDIDNINMVPDPSIWDYIDKIPNILPYIKPLLPFIGGGGGDTPTPYPDEVPVPGGGVDGGPSGGYAMLGSADNSGYGTGGAGANADLARISRILAAQAIKDRIAGYKGGYYTGQR